MEHKQSLLERLQQDKPLLCDGAMGTALHQRGDLPIHACFDELNLTAPDLVLEIHRNYIRAGAEIIETNTFGANRFKLGEHGLAGQLKAIIQAAVEIAHQAVGERDPDDTYIAGSVGPLGVRLKPYGPISHDTARAAFHEQIDALISAGVDLLLLETFADHNELLLAIEAARQIDAEIPIVAQATFGPDNMTLSGLPPARVADKLYKAGANVIGVNCSGGPAQLSQTLQSMVYAVPDARFSIQPNAGYPESVGGRVMYPAQADYFGDYALTFKTIGASIIGGCCGTTPKHIAAMREALDDPNRQAQEIQILDIQSEEDDDLPLPPTDLAQRLDDGLFTITVEMTPPRSYTAKQVLHQARLLRDAGADLLNVADTPAAKMKMSAWAVCHLLQNQVGVETVLHFPTRGRNLLRVQGDLLAAHALDLRNLFVVMGDPTRIGDYPDAMDSYDIVPSKLIGLIKHSMNQGHDMAGNSIGRPTSFHVGCALNMGADDLDREIRVLQKKLTAGADFALGQAVFDPPRIAAFHQRYEETTGQPFTLPVLMGVFPLTGTRQASFLHNEVPGITIPDAIFKRLEQAGEDAPAEGVAIARELVETMRSQIQGVYLIPAHGRYDLAAQLVDAIAGVKT